MGEQAKIRRVQDRTRRAGVSAQCMTKEQMDNWKSPYYEKPPEARERLKNNIRSSEKLGVLFGHLKAEEMYSVIDAMFPREAAAGCDIITQGEDGDNFYIIEEGSFDVFVQRGDAPPGKVCEYGPGDMFGELALMYNANRAATVRATSHAKLWALDRESFRVMLSNSEATKMKQYEGFLAGVEILKDLTKYELGKLSDMLGSECVDTGEVIIQQGQEGNYFYILEDGEAKAYIGGSQGEIEVKHYSVPGEYFGEIALLKSATRRATVRAGGSGCTVLSVSRTDFDAVLGPIKDILAKNIDKYPQYADVIREEEERVAQERAEEEKIHKMKDSHRRAGVSAPAVSDAKRKDWKPHVYEKPSFVREQIHRYVRDSEKLGVLFGHLTEDAVWSVIDAMFPVSVEFEENLITQGEEGDNFYIVEEGAFEVFVRRGTASPGKVCSYSAGDMFGELALMYNAPRAATVKASEPSKVWALDRESFQLMLTTAENTKKTRYEDFLHNIDLFKALTKYEVSSLSDMLESEVYDAGEDIVKQGDTGSYFYILEDGKAQVYIAGDRGEVQVKEYRASGDYFGEVALINSETRRATVRAAGEGCTVLSVSREDFDRVLGPIREILEKNIEKYPCYTDFLKYERP